MCLITSTGQILVKKGINRRSDNKYYREPFIFFGGILVLAAPMLYLKVLSITGLSGAYGLNGLSYIVIYIMGRLVLKERGSFFQALGLVFITCGVFIWSI
jgi:uncharacterized membrane protein